MGYIEMKTVSLACVLALCCGAALGQLSVKRELSRTLVREGPELRRPSSQPPLLRPRLRSIPLDRYKKILPILDHVKFDRAKELAKQLEPVLLKANPATCRRPTSFSRIPSRISSTSQFSTLPNTFIDGCCISTPFLGSLTNVRLLIPDLARNRTYAPVYHGDGYQLFQAVSCTPVPVCGCTCAQEHVIQNAVVLDHNNVPVNEIVVVPSCCKSIRNDI